MSGRPSAGATIGPPTLVLAVATFGFVVAAFFAVVFFVVTLRRLVVVTRRFVVALDFEAATVTVAFLTVGTVGADAMRALVVGVTTVAARTALTDGPAATPSRPISARAAETAPGRDFEPAGNGVLQTARFRRVTALQGRTPADGVTRAERSLVFPGSRRKHHRPCT